MLEQLIIAGFGGQGVLLMGQLLAYAGMLEGYNVSWLPSYGPEMRGGTANCSVIISDEDVASPLVVDATALLAMNRPSLEKFERNVEPGGKLFINSSLITSKSAREDISVFYVPVNEIAADLGNPRVANMVMLGAFLAQTPCVSIDAVIESLRKTWGPKREKLIPVNREALERGAQSAK